MKAKLGKQIGLALALASLLTWAAPAVPAQEIPAGTYFLVELRDNLDAKKVKRGKEFDARTLEALEATDGSIIPSGTKLKGRVTYVKDNELMLEFFRIETRRGKLPLVATPVRVLGERDVKDETGDEGEITSGGRGKSAAIGAAVGAGIGAAVGATQAGGRGAAIGAAAGAGGGALIGAAAGGRDLYLRKGARIELRVDRPLYFSDRRR